jgi:hypothetical protein
MQPNIPQWVPESAKATFRTFLADSNLSGGTHAALERLACRDEMRALWSKIPREPDAVVILTIFAFSVATNLEPPRPRDGEALIAHSRRHWKTTYGDIASRARFLLEGLSEMFPASLREAWPEFAAMEIDFDTLSSSLPTLAQFCDRLDAEINEWSTVIGVPPPPKPPRRRGGETAPQVYFSSIMSNWFLKAYGKPLDGVVATLETVAFNLPAGEVTDETIRGRRRSQTAPAGCEQKSR